MEANGKKMHIKQCIHAQFSVQPLLILLTLAPNRVSSAKLEIRIGQTESQRIGEPLESIMSFHSRHIPFGGGKGKTLPRNQLLDSLQPLFECIFA